METILSPIFRTWPLRLIALLTMSLGLLLLPAGTAQAQTAPSVTTPTSASITATSATLGGNATGDGGATITERGVVYSITTVNGNPLIGGTGVTKATSAGTTGVFTVNATGLTLGTGYSFKAYATNSVGTTYTSPVATFTTIGPDIRITPTSLNLAKSAHREIYVEIDWMESAGHSHKPSQAVIDRIVATFARDGYTIHIDVSNALTHQDTLAITNSPSGSAAVQAIRDANFNHIADPRYFYSIWGHNYSNNGTFTTSSGIADLPGRIHLVSLGSFSGQTGTEDNQVGTFIHEFGHNLNQLHGGADSNNYKPNYVSVMNYHYQLNGIGATLFSLGLANSSAGFNNFGYSHGTLPDLDENHLDETVGIGLGKAVDWNGDGDAVDTDIAHDLNASPWTSGTGARTIITDFDNWGGIAGNITAGIVMPSLALPSIPSESCITADEAKVQEGLLAAMRANRGEDLAAGAAAEGILPADGLTIFNDGTAPLVINAITAETSAPWLSVSPTFPMTIPAGGSRYVAVAADFSLAPPLTTTTRLLVQSNDPDENPYPGGINVTVDNSAAPTVTTPTSASITTSTVTLGGNVTSDNFLAITERGVVYSATATNANPLIGGTGVTKIISAGTTGIFTVNVSGLNQGTGYSFKAYAINSAGTTYTTPVSTFSTQGVPTLTAPTSASITATSATLGGNVTSDGNVTITERGVVYSITSVNSDPLIGGTGVTQVTGTGTTGVFTVGATGLTAGTGYSFKAYAINSLGTAYTAPVSTFTTLAAPSVTTPTSASITGTGATLGGNVTSDGGATITERGIVYSITSTNSDPSIAGPGVTKVTATGTTGIFSVSATGLSLGTGYSFKAYATNSVGTTYTTPASTFTTSSTLLAPTVTTPTSASITGTGATLGGNVTGDGGAAITERGVVYALTSVNSDPLIGGTGVTKVTGTGTTGVFTVAASGLTSGAGYSFKAYATNSVGTTYTTPVSTFTTQSAPTVTTPTSTSITAFTATLGGNVTAGGSTTITERGVVYAITSANSDPLIAGTGVTKVTATGTTGAFTVTASGLSQNTGYSYKAYATNSVGTTYTTPASTFTTAAAVPLAGTKTVGAGGNYASLTNPGGLFEAINGNGVNGSLIVQITGDLTAENGTNALNVLTGTAPSLKIFPTGAARVISGSLAGALIRLNGAGNVTLDGSLGGGGSDRSLTITNTNTSGPTVIALISLGTGLGASNNVIRNCNLSTGTATTTGYGISVGGSTPGTSGADNDNVTIQNNSITAAPVGIYAVGTASVSAGGDDNLLILGNSITYNSTLASTGIRVGNALNSSVSQNTVSEQTTASGASTAISIETGFVSSSVTRNLVTRSLTTNTGGWGSRGITVGTGTAASALTISNNIIYGVNGSNWSSFSNSSSMGIAIGTIGSSSTLTTVAGGIGLFHNSVSMSGSIGSGSTTALTAAIYIGSGASALDLRNNVFTNTQVGTSATQKNYAIYSAATAAAFTTIDYNDYFVSNTFNAASAIPGFLTSDRLNLAGLQTGFGQNTHSFTGDPLFTSATDLHVTSLLSPVANSGTPLVGVPVDFDGGTRSATTPDIGADEFDLPTVTTPTQTAITATSATLGGNVTGDGGPAIVERGVVYSLTAVNSDPLIGGTGVTKLAGPGTLGSFSVNAAGLAANTGYSFKAYATNGAGTTYTSPVSTFTTLTALNNWRVAFYGTASNAGDAADSADPYHTGIPNLAVFAILGPNQDPALATDAMLPKPVIIGGNCVVTFTQPAGVSGVTYRAEWKASLSAASWTLLSDTGSGSTHTFIVPIGGNQTLFIRLRVSTP